MTKELLQQALDALLPHSSSHGNSWRSVEDAAIEALKQALAQQDGHSIQDLQRYEPEIWREDRIRMEPDSDGDWVKYGDLVAMTKQEPCGCREGECETKKDKTCRMTIEIAERDGIPEWTPAIGIECAISNLRDDAARLRDGGYTPDQIANDLGVIADDLAKCKPNVQPDPQLCSFYQVDSFPALVTAQEQHIQKLQAKMAKPANPFHPLNSREG